MLGPLEFEGGRLLTTGGAVRVSPVVCAWIYGSEEAQTCHAVLAAYLAVMCRDVHETLAHARG